MRRWRLLPTPSVDPVGTAGSLALLAGLASLDWPFFEGMTASLSALALFGWLLRGGSDRRLLGSPAVLVALAASLAAWAFFLLAPPPAEAVRGALLGASGGLVGWIGRKRPAFGGMP